MRCGRTMSLKPLSLSHSQDARAARYLQRAAAPADSLAAWPVQLELAAALGSPSNERVPIDVRQTAAVTQGAPSFCGLFLPLAR